MVVLVYLPDVNGLKCMIVKQGNDGKELRCTANLTWIQLIRLKHALDH